nr:hypothetical protein Q903MT_gene1559 [Picea sitchensis]
MTRNCFIASTPIPINLAPASCSKFTLYRLTRVKAYSCYCLPSSLLFTYPQYYYCYFLPSFPTIAIAYKKDYCLPAFALLLLFPTLISSPALDYLQPLVEQREETVDLTRTQQYRTY